MPTWLIIGASRGIGFEFVRQLIARGDQVIATVRDPMNASDLWTLIGTAPLGSCRLLLCDLASEQLIAVCTVHEFDSSRNSLTVQNFVNELASFRSRGLHKIDYVVMNAGILYYPNVSQLTLKIVTHPLTQLLREQPRCTSRAFQLNQRFL